MRRRHVVSSSVCAVILLCVVMTSDADEVYGNVLLTVVHFSRVDVIPGVAWPAVDNNVHSSWRLANGQTAGDFTAKFDQPHTVSDTGYRYIHHHHHHHHHHLLLY